MSKTEKIRLLVDAHVFDQEFQGTRTFIREIYRALAYRPELELFFAAVDTVALQREFPGIPAVNFIGLKSRSSLFRLLVDMPAIIKRYRIEYAHFQYIVPLRKNCRFIVTTHDVIFKEFPQEFSFFYRVVKTILYRYGASRADILTTVSAYSRDSMERWLGIARGKTLLTPLAVDPSFFSAYDKTAVRRSFAAKYGFDKFILCVSRFESRKNHSLLLKSWLELGLYKQGYYLVMLGHRSLPVPEMDGLLGGLSAEVRSFVVMRSDVPDEELPFFYRAATVFVYPSKAEGFGLPPLEAAATQTPVICSNTTAMAAFDFFDAEHIDPEEQSALTARLSQFLQQGPDLSRLAKIADTVAKRYSWQHSADALFERLMALQHQATPVLVSS